MQLSNFKPSAGVIYYNQVCLPVKLEQVCIKASPWRVRERQWHERFLSLGTHLGTGVTSVDHGLDLFGNEWPPYGVCSTALAFGDAQVTLVYSVHHIKLEYLRYHDPVIVHEESPCHRQVLLFLPVWLK